MIQKFFYSAIKPLGYAMISCLLFSALGCSSIINARIQKESLMRDYTAGNFNQAVAEAKSKCKSRSGTGDELMWRLEEGSVLFADSKYKESLEAFSRCEAIIEDFENRATVNVRAAAAETESAATNQNMLPYQSNYAEKILINAYKALDYYALGDKDGARVELNRMRYRQKEATKKFDDDIREAQEEADKASQKNKINTKQIAGTIGELKGINEEMDKYSNKAYGNFLNPFATYLSAIGYLVEDNYSEALVDLRNLYDMEKSNSLIQRDLVTCAKRIGGQIPSELAHVKPFDYPLSNNIVFVFFANGLTAAKKAFTIHLVLPSPVGYTGVAFPILEYFPKPFQDIEASDSKGTYKTERLANMDSVITMEYKKALPAMITRTIISTAVKETASALAVEAARRQGNDAAWIGTLIATSAYKLAFNTADTRCWQTLPKEYQYTHFPKPEDGIVRIKAISAGGFQKTEEIHLSQDKKIAIIYVLSPGPDTMTVKVFEFNR